MAGSFTVILEGDHARLKTVLDRLCLDANSKFVFLVDKAGQQIAAAGDLSQVDPTALASLTAGNVAATEGVAQLVGEQEFSSLFHEGKHDSLHISVVANKAILLVVFDERSSLGLVRLRVSQYAGELSEIMREVLSKSDASTRSGAAAAAFVEITDEDIDALFG